MQLQRNVCLLVLAFAMAACATPIEAPKSFVKLGDGGEGYRATTNDDARLWVRTFRDATEADVEFWAGTLKRDFVEQRGYEKVDSGTVKNRRGEEGRWMEFSTNVRGERIDYMVAVWAASASWVSGGGTDITVVEFAANHDVYTARVNDVRAALNTVN